jgi:hypothetical protein
MFLRPFEHQRQCSPTQMPLENLQRSDVDQCFVFCVQRMEVRRSMIFLEHLNQDAIEGADSGHRAFLLEIPVGVYFAIIPVAR